MSDGHCFIGWRCWFRWMHVIVFCWSVLLPAVPASASETEMPPPSQGDLKLQVDAASFRSDDGPYEEVAIRFPAIHLVFKGRGDSLFVARYLPRLQLFDHKGKHVKTVEGERRATFSSEQETRDPERSVDDIARFRLPPGNYRAVLEVKAVGNDLSGRAEFPINVPEYKAGLLAFSDLSFIRKIDPPRPQIRSV